MKKSLKKIIKDKFDANEKSVEFKRKNKIMKHSFKKIKKFLKF